MHENFFTPKQLKSKFELNEVEEFVSASRQTIKDILSGKDHRTLAIVGPCSIHDPDEAYEYAKKLANIKKVISKFFLVMRVYVEKPRTSIGWKGLVSDPLLDGSNDIERGIVEARELMIKINELGLPVATEFLSPFVVPYLEDLVSWGAIGSRTVESQTHREMASNLKMPVGMKNPPSGYIEIAVNAMVAAKKPQTFLGIDDDGLTVINSKGNSDCHLVLRGNSKPNYSPPEIEEDEDMMAEAGIHPAIIVDCSHDNSGKDHNRQKHVLREVISQIIGGKKSIKGFMLESYLEEGHQDIGLRLKPYVSITDSCIGWNETEEILKKADDKLANIALIAA
jgi:3-deoxy-7-phosphoheptulonate synthase